MPPSLAEQTNVDLRLVEEREVTTLVLGVIIAAATVARWRVLQQLPGWPLVAAAGGCLLVAWTATVVEHLMLPAWLNTLEHVAYSAQSVLLAVWVWRLTAATQERAT